MVGSNLIIAIAEPRQAATSILRFACNKIYLGELGCYPRRVQTGSFKYFCDYMINVSYDQRGQVRLSNQRFAEFAHFVELCVTPAADIYYLRFAVLKKLQLCEPRALIAGPKKNPD